jgi:hypothetical protein
MDVLSLEAFGGAKKNYSPIVDPEVDEDAVAINRLKDAVAGSTHTLVRAIRSFVGVNGADPTDPPSGFVHDSVWGDTAPVKSTVARTGEGVWTVQWPATVDSELTSEDADRGGGVQYTVNLRRAWAQVECAGTLCHATAKVTSANTVEVRGWLANGTADDLTGLIITVFAR